MLGVHPATLRRWADQGDVLCVVTPGGHRRFPRTEIESLLRQRGNDTESVGDELIEKLLLSTRAEIARMDSARWMSAMSDSQRDHLRVEGRRVMELLRGYLADDADRDALADGVRLAGAAYAESAISASMSLTVMLEAVSFFRSHILETAVDQSNLTADERRVIFRNVNAFLNTLLLSMVETFDETKASS